MRRFSIHVSGILIVVSVAIAIVLMFLKPTESKRVRADYVGVDVCRKCHGIESIGNQYRIWAASTHAGAVTILKSGKGREIGKASGVDVPHSDYRCLKCHTTGGGKSEITKNEGVGCEACHGAGSEYFEFSNHASFLDREGAYRKAIRLGMYPIRGVEGIKSRERLCRHCHSDERPCLPADADERKRRKLSLSIIADLPGTLKHPLRR